MDGQSIVDDRGPAVGGFRVGDCAEFQVEIDQSMVDRFVDLTGDTNPVHIDPDFARETTLGRPVVHGMIGANFVSTLIGKHIPGDGAIWVSQSFEFRGPIRVGDRLTVRAIVVAVHVGLGVLTLDVAVINHRNDVVIAGEGKVKKVAGRQRVDRPVPAAGAMLVTGASGTIGAAIVRTLAAAGHPVAIGCGRNRQAADRLSRSLRSAGWTAEPVAADLTDPGAAGDLVVRAEQRCGPLAGIVHAASAPINPASLLPADGQPLAWSDIDHHMRVGPAALLAMAQAAAPGMAARNGGVIVTVTSEARDTPPPPGWAGYLAGKAALEAIARSLAAELGPKGIRVNIVSPGLVESEMTADVPERARQVLAQQTPLRRLCEPDDVAHAVAFLVGQDSAFMTGETLRLSGGRIMR